MDNQFGENRTNHSRHQHLEGRSSGNTALIATICALAILLIAAMLFFVLYSITGKDKVKKDDTEVQQIVIKPDTDSQDVKSIAAPPADEQKTRAEEDTSTILYWVRKSAYDENSQVGAYHFIHYAMECADEYANSGYEVYSIDGSLVYDPKDDVSANGVRYRVRKSANDADSQLGAYRELENAIAKADAYRNQGYEVYDMDGNLIYAP